MFALRAGESAQSCSMPFADGNGIFLCHNQHMHVTIDKAGRIVVPKALRERFGLREGSELEIEGNAEGILLKPEAQESGLVRDKHGWLVFTGKPVGNINWDRLVEDMREERIRKVGGW